MILKTYTHDRGGSSCWNFYDNIETASCYHSADTGNLCIALKFKGDSSDIILELLEPAYLCNDNGQTIEKLYPKAFKV